MHPYVEVEKHKFSDWDFERAVIPRMVGVVRADCICIVYLCVPVCVIEGGGGAGSRP